MDVLDAVVTETAAKPAPRKSSKRERAGTVERTGVGLVFAGSVSVERWEEEGRQLLADESASNWRKGDWWTYGERHYGDVRERAASLGLSAGTLSNIANVAKRVPHERRRAGVSWTHHQAVAYLDDTGRADELLARAESERLSVAALRALVNETAPKAPAAPRQKAAPVKATPVPAASVKVVGAPVAAPVNQTAPVVSTDAVRLEREVSMLRQELAHVRRVLELGADDPILPALRKAVELARKYGARVEAEASRVKVVAA